MSEVRITKGTPSIQDFYGSKGTPIVVDVVAKKFYILDSTGEVVEVGGGGPGTSSSVDWGDIGGTLSDQSDLNTALSDKAAASHTHVVANVTGLQTALDGKQATGSYGYVLNPFAANAGTTTDSQVIYWGGTAAVAPSTTAGNHRLYIPLGGAIKRAYIWAHAATAGTNESWLCAIRLNNSTDTTVQSLAANTAFRVWSNTSLNIAVSAGDYIELKMTNPAWATNPANVRFGGSIYIE